MSKASKSKRKKASTGGKKKHKGALKGAAGSSRVGPAPASAYRRVGGTPQLRRSLVAFIDLLGTSDHARGTNAQITLERLDTALTSAREKSGVDDGGSVSYAAWFSDNLAIGVPASADVREQDSEVGFMIVPIIWLQYFLAIDRFFVRGGITVGDHFADDRINYGPALVAAVSLEKAARHPRIAVDDRFLRFVDPHFRFYGDPQDHPCHVQLAVDRSDGCVFVSYLAAALEADDPGECFDMLELHRQAVHHQLLTHLTDQNPKVRDKYVWLAQYHNWFCRSFCPADELLIDLDQEGEFARYEP